MEGIPADTGRNLAPGQTIRGKTLRTCERVIIYYRQALTIKRRTINKCICFNMCKEVPQSTPLSMQAEGSL